MISTASPHTARPGVVGRVLQAHALLIGLVVAHYVTAMLVEHLTGRPFGMGILGILGLLAGTLVPVFLLVMLVWRFGHMMLNVRPARPIAWLAADLRRVLLDPERLVGGAVALTALILFQKSFGYLKEMVVVLNPFSWDEVFIAWDRALHFGVDPYLYLMPLVREGWAIGGLNAAYHAWFFLMMFLLFLACFDRTNPRARMTFLVAHVLTWAIGGNLVATLLSSAGPVYVERLGLGDTFVPLMDTLRAMSAQTWLPALGVQESLWQGYLGRGEITGISAMPSMHVGSTTLLLCYAFTWRRWAGIAMVGFWGLIMVGSVALGWHYAIDGYLGAVIALACWWIAARLVRLTQRAPGQADAAR